MILHLLHRVGQFPSQDGHTVDEAIAHRQHAVSASAPALEASDHHQTPLQNAYAAKMLVRNTRPTKVTKHPHGPPSRAGAATSVSLHIS